MKYYKTDLRRLPWALVWSWGGAGTLVLAVRKLLPLPFFAPVLVPEELSIDLLAEDRADPELLQMLGSDTGALVALGFSAELLYTAPVLGPPRGLGRAFLGPGGSAVCALVAVATGADRQVTTHLLSETAEGRLLGASSAPLRLPAVPGVDVLRLAGARSRDLAAAHLARLEGVPFKTFAPQDIVPTLRKHQQRNVSYYVSTGLYVEAAPDDIARARGGA